METFRVTPEDAERHPGIPVGARAVVVEGCVHVLSPSAYSEGK